jgi:hypothetical protein
LFLLLGTHGTGKTTYAKWISTFSNHKQTAMFCAIVGNETGKQAWGNIIPPEYIHDPSTAVDFLQKLRQTQTQAIMNYTNMGIAFPPQLHLTIFMDDVACIPSIIKSPDLWVLAINSRRVHARILITSQHLYQVPPQLRAQSDIIMSLATNNKSHINMLCEEYGINIYTFKKATEDHGIMVFDTTKSYTVERDVCVYAKLQHYPLQLERLGNPCLWEEQDQQEPKHIQEDM